MHFNKCNSAPSVSEWQGVSSAKGHRAVLVTSGITTIPLVLSFKVSSKDLYFNGKTQSTQRSTHNPRNRSPPQRSTVRVNSESCLSISAEKERDSNREANHAQCFKTPESVSAAEKKASSLIDTPALQVMVHCLSKSKRSATLSQITSKGFECHSA